MRPRPDPGAEIDHFEPCFFAQLAGERLLVRLAWLEPAAGRRPDTPRGEVEPDEQDPVGRVQDDGPCGLAQPHRRKSRNAWNQRNRSDQGTAAFAGEVEGSTKSAVSREATLLQAELGALAERASVGLLADEADRAAAAARPRSAPAARPSRRSRRA